MFGQFSLAQFDIGVFPAGYPAARQQWLAALSKLSYPYQHLAFECAGFGPAGDQLFTDSAWIGDEQAEMVLVLIGGTHGVEGFVGSAVQTDLLRQLAAGSFNLAEDCAILLIHALTPWGYAWLRRCDADGIDLNRNGVDFSDSLPENPDYQRLRPTLLLTDVAERQALFVEFAQQYGRVALETAISGGQYQDPFGPFYGGASPAHGRLVCEELINRYGLSVRRLAVIDLHTGLGPYGYGEIICDHQPNSAGAELARQWYGDSVTLPLAGTSSSVPKLGLMDYLWHGVMNPASCFITLEFGTYSTDQLFDVLWRDHLLWAQEDNEDERLLHSLEMRRHFCPNDDSWQEMVLFRARQVVAQASRGLRG